MPKSNKLFTKRHLRRKVCNRVKETKKLIQQPTPTAIPFTCSTSCGTSFRHQIQGEGDIPNSSEFSPSVILNPLSNSPSVDPLKNNASNAALTASGDIFEFDEIISEARSNKNNILENHSDVNHNEVFLKKLKLWACENNITHKSLNELLEIIRPKFPFLKKDARSILGTPRSVEKYSLGNGDLIYLGLEKGLRKKIEEGFESSFNKNEHSIPLQINIDGIPIFNNGAGQFWPILARSAVLKNKRPFSVAIFFGNGKPESLDQYLKSFIDECSVILRDGIEHLNHVYKIKLLFFSCDAPARAFLKQIMGHTSKSGCERCVIESKYENNKHFYPVNTPAELRKNEDFLGDLDNYSYIKGKSPLLKLNVKLISEFVLDPMHLIYLGAVKRLLMHWIEGKRPFKLSKNIIDNINRHIQSMKKYIGDDFPRKIRPFSLIKHWKATEYRFFLLYCGSVVLRSNLNNVMYKHFLLLHCAVFILSNKHLTERYFEVAKSALIDFVRLCPDVYDSYFVVYNIHSLIHVCEDVSRYGSLDDYSCFPFENYLGQLKRRIRGKYLPLQQIFNRLKEIDDCVEKKDQTGEIRASGAFDNNDNYCQFKKLEVNNMILSTDCKNNIVARLNKIYKIQSILFMDGVYKCVACPFKYLQDFYDHPIKSSKLGIYFGKGEKERTIFNVSEITSKYLSLPFKDGFVLVPLLHTYKT